MREFSVAENMTIANLSTVTTRGFLSRRRERAEVDHWIDICGVRPRRPKLNILGLSGGNQQKVAFGKVARTDPRILLLDDPTRGVDVGAKEDLHELIETFTERGTAVVLCSSESEELVRMCHRTLVLRRGKQVAELGRGTTDPNTLTQLAL